MENNESSISNQSQDVPEPPSMSETIDKTLREQQEKENQELATAWIEKRKEEERRQRIAAMKEKDKIDERTALAFLGSLPINLVILAFFYFTFIKGVTDNSGGGVVWLLIFFGAPAAILCQILSIVYAYKGLKGEKRSLAMATLAIDFLGPIVLVAIFVTASFMRV